MSEWKLIDKNTPEHKWMLFCSVGRSPVMGVLIDGKPCCPDLRYTEIRATHWMELPDGPKEVKDE